jgi:hypothetical protein
MLFNLHKDEWVIPAGIASGLQGVINSNGNSGGAQGGGGGGNVHIEQHLHITTMDGASVMAHANRFAPVYAKAISTQLQRHPSLRGDY